MGWNYSDLSHEAKEHGGPEQYISDIKDDARKDGHMDMIPWLLSLIPIAATAGGLITNWWNNRETKKKAKEAERKIISKCKSNEMKLKNKQDLSNEEGDERKEDNEDGQSINKRE